MGVCTLVLSMSACKSNSNKASDPISISDNSQNALDWQGSYNGTLPCTDPDCMGIETVVSLNSGNSYTITRRYLNGENQTTEDTGKFQWNKDGSAITLDNGKGDKRAIKVGENRLFWLDQDGKIINGELAEKYILHKVNLELVEKYWKLTELFGEPIKEGDVAKDAYITLRMLGNRLEGNGGCNSFFGSYEANDIRIRFSQVGSTMMMCPSMDIESKMKQVLEQADNFYAKNDTLVLNRARMAPLARFVAVYM